MKPVVDLSPLGTARPEAEDPVRSPGSVRCRSGWRRRSASSRRCPISPGRWPAGRPDLDAGGAAGAGPADPDGAGRLAPGEHAASAPGRRGACGPARRRLPAAGRRACEYAARAGEPAGSCRPADRLGPCRPGRGEAGDFKPLIVAGAYLYLQKMHDLEERFAASLRAPDERRGPGMGRKRACAGSCPRFRTGPAVRDANADRALRRSGRRGANRAAVPAGGHLRAVRERARRRSSSRSCGRFAAWGSTPRRWCWRPRPARRRTALARPSGRDSRPSSEPSPEDRRAGEPGRSADAP